MLLRRPRTHEWCHVRTVRFNPERLAELEAAEAEREHAEAAVTAEVERNKVVVMVLNEKATKLTDVIDNMRPVFEYPPNIIVVSQQRPLWRNSVVPHVRTRGARRTATRRLRRSKP